MLFTLCTFGGCANTQRVELFTWSVTWVLKSYIFANSGFGGYSIMEPTQLGLECHSTMEPSQTTFGVSALYGITLSVTKNFGTVLRLFNLTQIAELRPARNDFDKFWRERFPTKRFIDKGI